MQLAEGALDWPLLPTGTPAGLDATSWGIAVQVAVEWLWRATAQMFGTRQTVYRPQALVRSGGCWQSTIPYLQSIYGPLDNQGWPFIGDPRDPVTTLAVLELPGPVVEVTSVTVAGVVVDPALYRVDGDWLVRLDGLGWPRTQDLIASLGGVNTWAVSYKRGRPVPPAGQVAAQRLAVAWYPAIHGDPAKCSLPFNATSVSRGGVTINRDVLKALKTTGVQVADVWVGSVNPLGATSPGGVWSPDLARGGRPYLGSGIPA